MKRVHLLAVLVSFAIVAVLGTDAFAVYHPTLGRFLQRDPAASGPMRVGLAGSAVGGGVVPRDAHEEGMSLYQYARSAPTLSMDPLGLWSIVVDLPKNRALVGKLFLYDDNLTLHAYAAPARGQGNYVDREKRTSKPWWQRNGDTPTGVWTGKLMGVAGDKDDTGPYGVGDRIALTAVSGHAKEAVEKFGRFAFRIHGGREQWLRETAMTVAVKWTGREEKKPSPMPKPEDLAEGEYYKPSKKPGKIMHWRPSKWARVKTVLPGNTSGCVRLSPKNMKRLVKVIQCLIKKGEAKKGRVVVKGPQEEAPK